MLKVNGKIGTHCSDIVFIRGNKPPKVGDFVWIKSERDYRCRKWTKAKIDMMNSDGFCFFALF